QVAEKWYDAVPPLDGDAGGSAARGPSRTTAPALFAVTDADKDGSLTRDELKTAFTKWFTEWDTAKAGTLDQDALAKGLDAKMPPAGSGQGNRGNDQRPG